jgi:hypothetical protein
MNKIISYAEKKYPQLKKYSLSEYVVSRSKLFDNHKSIVPKKNDMKAIKDVRYYREEPEMVVIE